MRPDDLTPQQLRVADLVATGKTDKEVCDELRIGKAALWWHLRRIASKWRLRGNVRVQIANRMHGIPDKAA